MFINYGVKYSSRLDVDIVHLKDSEFSAKFEIMGYSDRVCIYQHIIDEYRKRNLDVHSALARVYFRDYGRRALTAFFEDMKRNKRRFAHISNSCVINKIDNIIWICKKSAYKNPQVPNE